MSPGPRGAGWAALPPVVALALCALLAGTAYARLQVAREAFPHPLHEGLFPVCQGCHSGIESGDPATLYPPPSLCGTCHDGRTAPPIDWSGPPARPTNLRFSHQGHAGRPTDDGEPATCQTCHQTPGAQGRMAISLPSPDRCTACHAHQQLIHPDGGQACTVCHRPLVDVPDLPAERIARFPKPSSHGDPGFLSTHGPDPETAGSTCATCHARPSCERCHVNADRVEAIRVLRPDSRVEALVAGREPAYPTPETHDGSWLRAHGPVALEGVSSCANCHARPSCLTCHRAGLPAFDGLPAPEEGGPAGVVLDAAESRARLHPPDFARHHGVDAATASDGCSSCHAQEFCTTCHSGPESAFHPLNFLETHGSRAYGADGDCTTCHNPELFCRSCHADVGLASSGRLNSGFHDAQPFWLIAHGKAARQDLGGCVTCHAQTDCATCHSPLGGWGVNPHGAGFEPDRFRESAPTGCVLCHLTGIPVG